MSIPLRQIPMLPRRLVDNVIFLYCVVASGVCPLYKFGITPFDHDVKPFGQAISAFDQGIAFFGQDIVFIGQDATIFGQTTK